MPAGKPKAPEEALNRIEECRRTGSSQLDLSSLGLGVIPESLSQLANLQDLYLYSNQITAIPESLSQLANLQTLYLFDNQITAIPESLSHLANLQILYLSGNQITAIPESLSQLANLQTLDLSRNQITAIPESLSQLANLRTLDLSRNQITTIPESLTQLQNLTALFLHDNPRLGILDEILGPTRSQATTRLQPKPPSEILTYYFSQRKDSRPLNEAKLILVGQGGVGKTSLVKRLTTGKFNPRERSTEGIKISDWSCALTRADKVTVHIWDFGGQEMMHATHQFFLTARTLYLLVLNRRQGRTDEEADYWFRLIRAFGGKEAPVIVVLNKQRTEPFDVNRRGWLEKYKGNIVGFAETDCSDAKSIKALELKIKEQLTGLKSLKAGFPGRWFAIKNELATMTSDYVTFEDYRAICRKHGEEDPASQTSLAGFLHDLGIALNYKDDLRLRFAYVLKPEWVTAGIYALLHAFVTSKGVFSRSEAEAVLKEKYSPEATDFILGLMEQFELSFPLTGLKKRILIPQLLDDQQPDSASGFKPAECLNFGYQYTVVPEGLLPRFIVRTHHLSEPSGRWKSGVILNDRDSHCRALVRADSADRQVRIHVAGPEAARQELLAVIRHNLNAIHSDYEFQPAGLVYPPGVPDKPLRVDDLQALLNSGKSTTAVVLPDRVIEPAIADLIAPVKALAPLKLFVSYSHIDEKYVDELRKRLKIMERNGQVEVWYDRDLTAGEKSEPRILQKLTEADAVIFQLSPDFVASDFCVGIELATTICRKESGEVELIAYVLHECSWKDVANLKEFQVLPKDAKAMRQWRDRNEYWQAISDGIKDALKKLRERRSETQKVLTARRRD